jgi:hypothetical protein
VLLAVLVTTFRVDFVTDFFNWMGQLFSQITGYYAINGAAFVAEGLVLVFLSCAGCCLEFYAAMAVGHSFAGHKGILSVAFFLIFQFALQFVGISGMLGLDGLDIFADWNPGVMGVIHALMGASIGVTLAVGAIFYGITVYMLQKHLNLE